MATAAIVESISVSAGGKDAITVAVKITSSGNISNQQSSYLIQRKSSDFTWLRSALAQAEAGCVVPALIDLQSHDSSTVDCDQIKASIQLFFDRLLVHPKLSQSQPLANFFKPDQSYAPYFAGTKVRHSGGFFKSMAKSMRASKEIDTWFDQSKADIAVSSEFSEKCIKAAQRLCYARISLAESCRDLARKLSDFGDFDTQLSSVRHFAVNFEKTSTGLEKQTQAMDRSLINGLRLVSVHCDSAEIALEDRWNSMLDYEDACKSTQKRQHAVEKMKGTVQVRAEKADIASTELHQAELFEKQIKETFDRISTQIRSIEWPLLVQNISSDLKQTLVSTASAQQNIDRDIMNEWSSSGAQFTSTAGDHTMAIVSSDGINHRDAVDKIEAQVL